jgi:hypothetical protein
MGTGLLELPPTGGNISKLLLTPDISPEKRCDDDEVLRHIGAEDRLLS